MPKVRSATIRNHPQREPTRAELRAMRTELLQYVEAARWRQAVHVQAWRTAWANGTRWCGTPEFDQAEADVIASGHPRPPEAWLDRPRPSWLPEPQIEDPDPNLTSRDLGTGSGAV